MEELKKYKNVLIYTGIVVFIVFMAYKQLQPKIKSTIDLFNQVKTQTEVDTSLANQVATAKAKEERKKKLRLVDDMTKKIYQQDDGMIDNDATFAFLLDDAIELLRKNHIKTHSIQSTINPEDDVFVKGEGAKYAACRLSMKMISDYSDFKNFLEDLYKYPYLVNINSIEIFPYQKNKKILLINFTFTMYASRSDEQAAAVGASAEGENKENQPEGEGEGEE